MFKTHNGSVNNMPIQKKPISHFLAYNLQLSSHPRRNKLILFPVNCEKFVSLFAKHLFAVAHGSTMEQLTVITVCTWLAFSSTARRLAPSLLEYMHGLPTHNKRPF